MYETYILRLAPSCAQAYKYMLSVVELAGCAFSFAMPEEAKFWAAVLILSSVFVVLLLLQLEPDCMPVACGQAAASGVP